MPLVRWIVSAALPLAAAPLVIAAARAPRHAPAPIAPVDSVIVHVTSSDRTTPVTFEGRYLATASASAMIGGGDIPARQTPYTLALPASEFQGLFRETGASGHMRVELQVRRGGRTTATATTVTPISLVVANRPGGAGATGF